ncbi:MAG TPA: DUF2628 domain-containing protein [Devosiaceae bacterium]|jgi:hypothetical protein
MTIYTVFDRNDRARHDAPAVVPEKFSWFAFLLPPVYALVHRLWRLLAGYVVAVLALQVASRLVGGEAGFWLYWLMALWIGFAVPGMRRQRLARSGWSDRGAVVAAGPDLAQLAYLQREALK